MTAKDMNEMYETKKPTLLASVFAEAEGFEPPVPCGTPVFKTGAIDQLCQTSRGANLVQ